MQIMGHWLIFQPEISFSHLRLHCLSSLTVKSVTTYIHTVLIQLRHISETDCIAAFIFSMLTPRGHRSNELQPRLHHKLYPTVLLMEAMHVH